MDPERKAAHRVCGHLERVSPHHHFIGHRAETYGEPHLLLRPEDLAIEDVADPELPSDLPQG